MLHESIDAYFKDDVHSFTCYRRKNKKKGVPKVTVNLVKGSEQSSSSCSYDRNADVFGFTRKGNNIIRSGFALVANSLLGYFLLVVEYLGNILLAKQLSSHALSSVSKYQPMI